MDEAIDFYDTNFIFGENNLDTKYSVDDSLLPGIIEERFRKMNIKGTIAGHFLSYFYYPRAGNDHLAALYSNLRQNSGQMADPGTDLKLCLAFEQEYMYEKDLEKELARRYSQGFRVIRMSPKSHKYPFEASMMKKAYELFAYYSFPVMVSLDEIDITGDKYIEWAKLLEISAKFKQLPVIVDGGNSKELSFNSYLFPLLLNSESIFLNTHNLLAFNQLEDIANVCGADKLIFDSYFPYYVPGLSVERILNAGLSTVDKKKISSGNIKKIMENIKIS